MEQFILNQVKIFYESRARVFEWNVAFFKEKSEVVGRCMIRDNLWGGDLEHQLDNRYKKAVTIFFTNSVAMENWRSHTRTKTNTIHISFGHKYSEITRKNVANVAF